MSFKRITEEESYYSNLETKPTAELLADISREDHRVADAVQTALPDIARLVDDLVPRLRHGGRVFYIGAGTSGRLGVLDASELPPTFGVKPTVFTGIIAGGDTALRNAVEGAEDDAEQGWKDLLAAGITEQKPVDDETEPSNDRVGEPAEADDGVGELSDANSRVGEPSDANSRVGEPRLNVVIGISASGTAPYVLGALREARSHGFLTAGITNNPGSPLATEPDHAITVVVGPEVVTGSSRMKAGTSQKMVLNMISTATMIRLGHVRGNRMIDMQLTNQKLVDRGTRMLVDLLHLPYDEARQLLLRYGSVDAALKAHVATDDR